MLKICNIFVILTTLGIASVAHAGNNPNNGYDPYRSSMLHPMFPISPLGLMGSPMGLSRSFSSRSFDDDYKPSFQPAVTQINDLPTKGSNIDEPLTTTSTSVKECCDMNVQNCHPMRNGENCYGTVRKVKTKTSVGGITGTIGSSKTPTNNYGDLQKSSPTKDNSQISPRKDQRGLSKQLSNLMAYDKDDNENSEEASQITDPYQKSNVNDRQNPNSKSLSKNGYDNTYKTPMGQQFQIPQPLSNRFINQNPLSKLSPNSVPYNGNSPKDWKMTSGSTYGMRKYISYPDEKPAEPHQYERPLGLTDNEVDEIRRQVLKQTNLYRAKYGISPLSLNTDMNQHAQQWANHLAPKHTIFHRGINDNKIYGENLYLSSSDFGKKVGKVCVDTWYQELRFVEVGDDEKTYENNPRGAIGHLTALLWKRSKEMGVGASKNDIGQYIIAANYNPGGNVGGFYMENLPVFEQKDIDEAKSAWDEFSEEHLTEKTVHMVYDPKTGQFVPDDGSEPIASQLPQGFGSLFKFNFQ